jgi:alpha-L-arabinofuranosidase
MRRGDVVEIATQSMLVGKTWPIAAILVDPNGAKPPRPTPSGMVTALYSRHHGDRLMEMQASGVPTYAQNLRLEGIRPSPKVAMIDALATADANAVYWHAINRSFGRALEVKVDLSALGPLAEKARVYVLEGRLDDEVAIAVGEPIAWVRQEAATVKNGVATLKLPARSVVVLEVLRK